MRRLRKAPDGAGRTPTAECRLAHIVNRMRRAGAAPLAIEVMLNDFRKRGVTMKCNARIVVTDRVETYCLLELGHTGEHEPRPVKRAGRVVLPERSYRVEKEEQP